jgi:hypothetical protein
MCIESSHEISLIDSVWMSAQNKSSFDTEIRTHAVLSAQNHHLMEGRQMLNTLRTTQRRAWWLVCLSLLLITGAASAQVDQGAITGTVTDNTGAIVPGAQVTLTATDTGFTLQQKSNGSGNYTFSPIKIGNYTVSASAPNFQTTSRPNVHVDVQQRLQVNLALSPGQISQTVTVTGAVALLQTQSSAVGQVVDTKTINDTPLNGRNWVYIAQLTAGVAPPFGNTRGSGTGDFVANGQRAEQNNFILDGVDNNTNLVDFLNGSSSADQQLQRGVRTLSRRGDERQHQVRYQPDPRGPLGVCAQHKPGRAKLECADYSAISPEPIWRDSGISYLEEQTVLLWGY